MGRMPKGVHVTLTTNDVCYYEVGDRTYARKKSSLTRKRVLKSKEFEKTRKYASDLGRASRIGSAIYRALPNDIAGRWLYRAITGEAASLLYEGKEEQEVKAILWKKYIEDTDSASENEAIDHIDKFHGHKIVNVFPSTRESNLKLRDVFYDLWQKQGKPIYYFKRAWSRRTVFKPEKMPQMLWISEIPRWS